MNLEDKMSVLLSIKLLRESIQFWDELLEKTGMPASSMEESQKAISERINDYVDNILTKQDADKECEFIHKKMALRTIEDDLGERLETAFQFYERNREKLSRIEHRIQDSLTDHCIGIVQSRMINKEDRFLMSELDWPVDQDDHLAPIVENLNQQRLKQMQELDDHEQHWQAVEQICLPANDDLCEMAKTKRATPGTSPRYN